MVIESHAPGRKSGVAATPSVAANPIINGCGKVTPERRVWRGAFPRPVEIRPE
jgi:hypothetical protein